MKKWYVASVALIVLSAGVLLGITWYSHSSVEGFPPREKLASCYHGVVAGADSVFTVDTQEKNGYVSGKMSFVNKQKDSSYGTYEGTFEDGLLKVKYTFWSEGLQSVGDYSFVQSNKDFVGSGYTYKVANDCDLFTTRKLG